jgi:hypothetical protein
VERRDVASAKGAHGLAVNAAFHIAWFDSIAALAAIPILIKEGGSA